VAVLNQKTEGKLAITWAGRTQEKCFLRNRRNEELNQNHNEPTDHWRKTRPMLSGCGKFGAPEGKGGVGGKRTWGGKGAPGRWNGVTSEPSCPTSRKKVIWGLRHFTKEHREIPLTPQNVEGYHKPKRHREVTSLGDVGGTEKSVFQSKKKKKISSSDRQSRSSGEPSLQRRTRPTA